MGLTIDNRLFLKVRVILQNVMFDFFSNETQNVFLYKFVHLFSCC